MDETLVHYVEDDDSAYIQIRPNAEDFLETMSNHFELVVFTAAMREYADFVLNRLDYNNRISHRLYRDHTFNENGINIKDLSKLGRDLNKTVIVDNVKDNFKLQPKNGMHIKNFEGDENDDELTYLQDILVFMKINMLNVPEFIENIKLNMKEKNSYINFDFENVIIK